MTSIERLGKVESEIGGLNRGQSMTLSRLVATPSENRVNIRRAGAGVTVGACRRHV